MPAEKDVKYETIVMDDLPERPPHGSKIEDAVTALRNDPQLVGKFVCIAQYAQSTAATAAANILRKRHGWPEVAGLWFGTRKVPGENGEADRTGLFVQYDPSKVKAGEAEKHAHEKAEREKAKAEKKANKKGSETPAAKGASQAASKTTK